MDKGVKFTLEFESNGSSSNALWTPHFVRLWFLNFPEHFVVAWSFAESRVFAPPATPTLHAFV